MLVSHLSAGLVASPVLNSSKADSVAGWGGSAAPLTCGTAILEQGIVVEWGKSER